MFSIFDQKGKAFMRPFAAPTTAFALRSFADMASEADSFVAKHPEDYFLFRVGSFKEEDGSVEAEKVSLGCALEFLPGGEG
nr:MAG: nonstructural protein [Microvirus sp.]